MPSAEYEHDIDVSLVARLISSQFPQWSEMTVTPIEPGGWDNRSFRLGEEMIVRLPSAERYAKQVHREQRWLPKLAPHLPLPVPKPLAQGAPAHGYPWHWSAYRWLEGERAAHEHINDMCEFARSLAHFLTALQHIDPAGGPPPGSANFHRGDTLKIYDAETRDALRMLRGVIDANATRDAWEEALDSTWHGPPVWLHGDVSADNLLVGSGRLFAVIDFGGLAIGDPACDLAIAWTFLSGASRSTFRAAQPTDVACWTRGRGWALWKALVTLVKHRRSNPIIESDSRRIISELLADRSVDA